ncbi:TolB-like translocation protein [Aegicerativicinus sediminis]|uniref:exo-alpha-sialidase n=1 Tax=Aegicerativicinus sediminis TaxID=2893202 RepID=UPI001E326460|nr:exo-alpha-sialidase [Aegicerativicinus sediminis]
MTFQCFFCCLILFLLSCKSEKPTEITGPIITLQNTSTELELFGEGIVSTALYERDIAISQNGNELVFTLGDFKQNNRCLVILSKLEGNWSQPQILPFSGKYQDIEPFFTTKGNRLYFASNRPIYNDKTRSDYNIWYVDRAEDGWSEPIAMDTLINTTADEFYPSLSDNGNLYFTTTKVGGIGREDIFVSEFQNGKYNPPFPLPIAVNSATYEFNSYISPEEDLLIFSSYGREDDLGGGDLYFSIRDDNGNWKEAENMGSKINSNKLDFCPFIDWKNQSFYFTSERGTELQKPIKSVEELKEIVDNVLNGYGNIFRIDMEEIKPFQKIH